MSGPGRPGGPARLAVLRWSTRLFRREWRQQLLVLALLTVAVAVAVTGISMAMNASAATNAEFGNASAMARLDASDPATAQRNIAAARGRFGTVEVISHQSVAVPGSAASVDLRSQDPSGAFGAPLLALRSGRYPTQADEVALTDAVATLLSAHVGDRVELGGVERTLVGRVENPRDLNDEFALVAPDEQAPADSVTLLFENNHGPASGPPAASEAASVDFPVMSHDDGGPVAAIVLVATTLAMALVGLVAATGFVVVARRRQRQLGLLAAIGGTQQQLRMVMVADGALVGLVAALLGGILGVLGWIAAAPAIEVAAARRIDRFDLPWGLLGVTLALAVLTAVAAAWWPARTVARLSVTVALSGRPSPPLPVRRSSVLALVFAAAGMGGIAASHPTADHVRPLLLIGGVVAVVVGVVLAAPAAIRALAAPAGRLPFAPRLALRDLVRFQARAAAALAAITLTLGLSVAVVGIAQANQYRADEGNLSARQILIRAGDPHTGLDPSLGSEAVDRLDAEAATIAATVDQATTVDLDVAMNPAAAADPNNREPVGEAVAVDVHDTRLITYPYVATPELLQSLGIDPAAIDPGTDLLTARTDDVGLFDITARKGTPATGARQRIDLPGYSSAPTALVTEGALERNGWVAVRAGWLVESPHALTSAQVAAARAAAAEAGLTIETRSGQDGLDAVRSGSTAGGIGLALAIVAMTIGLIRGEAAGDLRTLTATGASGRTRRALTASTAAALTLLGVVLGMLGAYLALAAAYHADLGRLIPLPFRDLVLVAVGLPVLATATGWLVAGREPRTFSRQVLD